MRKLTLIALAVFLSISMFAQKGFVNPAAKYAEMLGYDYQITKVRSGDVGMVKLPDGTTVNAWDFFKGKVAQDYSYGARYGYETETETVTENGYTTERAVCIRVNKRGAQERIPLLDLMEMNGDPLITSENRRLSEFHTDAKVDPNFTVNRSTPSSFDWRNKDGHAYIGAPRNQGTCGSCYSFGAAAAAEGTYNVATGSYDSNVADFSEAYIAWCLSKMPAYSSHFSGCNGADYDYMELQALVDVGICDESYYPYTTTATQDCPAAATNAPKTKFASWNRVPCLDTDAIKTAIMTYGVVDAAVYVSTAFQNYTGGVFSDASTSCNGSPCYNTTTNHAISLVGWGNDATYGDYWILRNSWGSSWGEGGYMRIQVASARVACSVCYMTYVNDGTTVPTVSTNNVTSIADLSATCGGNITDNGGATVTASGVVYAKTAAPTLATGTVVNSSPLATSGSYTLNMTGLTSGTNYYVRSFATNSKGTAYGAEKSFTTTGDPQIEYCTSQGKNSTYEWISGVEIGSFTNTSGASNYTDFTSKTVNMAAGTDYAVTLTPDFSGTAYNEYWKIWVDLNKDGDFDDANELIFDAGSLSKTVVTGTATIPAGTAAVVTRMRVSMRYDGAQAACDEFSYGEVEDYTVNITSGSGNIAPTANANGVYNGVEGTAINFSSAGSTDSDGTIASYSWSFGDGATSTAANPSHTYASAGTYNVSLTVTDNSGATDTDQTTAVITSGGSGDEVELAYSTFEDGFGIWTDGGNDCSLYTSGVYAFEGNNAANIQDNSGVASSFYLTNGIDVSTPGFVQIVVEFNFYAYSMETGEDFWLQYYDGSSWTTIATYTRGTNIDNNTFYAATVNIYKSDINFPTGMKLRFMCDASGNSDDVYIDNIKIIGKTVRTLEREPRPGELPSPEHTGAGSLEPLRRMVVSDDRVIIFPNPVQDELIVKVALENVDMKIINSSGAVVKVMRLLETVNSIDVSNLPSGVYMVYIENDDEPIVERFIKQ